MDVDVLSPDPAILSCTATREPTPQFTWTKVFPNGTTVETLSESMDSISVSTTFSGENITSILTIEPTDAFDTANYSCTAKNTFGPVTGSEVEVTVFGMLVFTMQLMSLSFNASIAIYYSSLPIMQLLLTLGCQLMEKCSVSTGQMTSHLYAQFVVSLHLQSGSYEEVWS